MNWRAHLKRWLPASALNETLLRFPALYGTPLVHWESNLFEHRGLDDLREQLEACASLDGDVVECGASRCGGSAVMAKTLRRLGCDKVVVACDSFVGFDRDELQRERDRGWANAPDDAFTSTSLDYVRRKLEVLGLASRVRLVPGFFQETLPGLSGPWCMALIDCDLMDSLAYCAARIWPRLVPGGRLVFDDYTSSDFGGARRGVDAFVEAHRGEISRHGLARRLYFVERAVEVTRP